VEGADTRDPTVYLVASLRHQPALSHSTPNIFTTYSYNRLLQIYLRKPRLPISETESQKSQFDEPTSCKPRHFQPHPNPNNLDSPPPSKCLKNTKPRQDHHHQPMAPKQHLKSTPHHPCTPNRPLLNQSYTAYLHTKATPTRNRTMAIHPKPTDTMRLARRWGIHNSRRWDMVRDMDKEDMVLRRVDIIMVGMRQVMDLRVNIWMIGGAEAVGLWRRCWRVWHAAVAWMRVCYSKRRSWRNDTQKGDWNVLVRLIR